MKIKKIINSKYFTWFLLMLVLMACSWSLILSGLGSGHDTNHEARIYEMAIGLKESVFPVIWSQNFTFGYGMPLFEFYAPLPYFIGAIFYLLGFNLSLCVELLYLFCNLMTLIGSYWLGKEILKNRWAALLMTTAITLAPYRAVDLNIRGAFSEAYAITFIIFTLLGIVKIIDKNKGGIFILAFSFAALILSHNLTALMSLPFLILFGLVYLLIKLKENKEKLKALQSLFIGGLLGLGLSCFYFLPALLEKEFTQIDKYVIDDLYNYRKHFLYIRQFFKPWSNWEYGGSGWGPDDEMSFFLGFGQISALLLACILILFVIIKKIKVKNWIKQINIAFILLLGISLFFTILKAQFFWEFFDFFKYFQFPWRFLSLSLIFIGFLAGINYLILNPKYRLVYFLLLFICIVGINTKYFRSEHYINHQKNYIDYAKHIREYQSMKLFDYIPKDINFLHKYGYDVVKNFAFSQIKVPNESLLIEKTNSASIILDKTTKKYVLFEASQSGEMVINLAYYPGWEYSINDLEFVPVDKNENGLVLIELPKGESLVKMELKNTPLRFWSKIISLVSIIIIGFSFVFRRYKKLADHRDSQCA